MKKKLLAFIIIHLIFIIYLIIDINNLENYVPTDIADLRNAVPEVKSFFNSNKGDFITVHNIVYNYEKYISKYFSDFKQDFSKEEVTSIDKLLLASLNDIKIEFIDENKFTIKLENKATLYIIYTEDIDKTIEGYFDYMIIDYTEDLGDGWYIIITYYLIPRG